MGVADRVERLHDLRLSNLALDALAERVIEAKREAHRSVVAIYERVGGIDHHLACELVGPSELQGLLGRRSKCRKHDELTERRRVGERLARASLALGDPRLDLLRPGAARSQHHLVVPRCEPAAEGLPDVTASEHSDLHLGLLN